MKKNYSKVKDENEIWKYKNDMSVMSLYIVKFEEKREKNFKFLA
jgi:hypothetical protein